VPWYIYVSCQNRAVQCITTRAVQFSKEQYRAVQIQRSKLQYITLHYSAVPAGMISMGFVTSLASSLLGLENIHPKGNRKHGHE
jgi:hypothetical protein